jgi:membrane fusion protein (multidrug efflux system)
MFVNGIATTIGKPTVSTAGYLLSVPLVIALTASTVACRRAVTDTQAQQPLSREPTIVTIEAAGAVERELPTVIRATGTFVADESSDVTAQVSGSVLETAVKVGDVVAQGHVIVRLDARNAMLDLELAQAGLQQAEAQSRNAKVEADRNAGLVKSGDISRSTYEKLTTQLLTADAAVAQAKARVATATKAVEDTRIMAPFGGHVSARPVAVGEYVTPTTKLATILRIQPIKLQLQVSESDAGKLKRGMAVRAEVPAHPKTAFRGTVSALNVALDPNSRAMTIDVQFPNADDRLLPGMFGTAEIQLPETERVVYVPRAAVSTIANGQSSAVYLIEGSTARVRVVQTGEVQGELVRILAGISGGAVVATTRVNELFDGAHVRIASPVAHKSVDGQ